MAKFTLPGRKTQVPGESSLPWKRKMIAGEGAKGWNPYPLPRTPSPNPLSWVRKLSTAGA